MKRINQGFTLIELMIVLAIIGILAAVAIPQYRQYVVQADIQTSVESAVRTLKTDATGFAVQHGGFPTVTGGAGKESLYEKLGWVKTGDGAGTVKGLTALSNGKLSNIVYTTEDNDQTAKIEITFSDAIKDLDGSKLIMYGFNVKDRGVAWGYTPGAKGSNANARLITVKDLSNFPNVSTDKAKLKKAIFGGS